MEKSQRSWSSLLEASYCMRIHLENASRYQQVMILSMYKIEADCRCDYDTDDKSTYKIVAVP